ncbi:P-loop containing nucleoside triphosphate hydrolase protein [Wilcoxina mikolae CBS 423.85]|nr:P-loop containing nucleoside triphosphate hydrolase protein [Wilcoxina mikolae CBS 423.85]
MSLVSCPVCSKEIPIHSINKHLDSDCNATPPIPASTCTTASPAAETIPSTKVQLASIFAAPLVKKQSQAVSPLPQKRNGTLHSPVPVEKRPFDHEPKPVSADEAPPPPTKRQKATAALRDAMPLAEKMRPQSLDDVCGQELVGRGGVLRGLIEEGRVPSMILWGTSGCGKTTIARVIANVSRSRFVEMSATSSGVPEFKKIFAEAKSELLLTGGRKTILFVDEIHRLNKGQQDVFLAPVERGEITLIGATTENPSFKVQNALLSRCRTFTLTKLSQANVEAIIRRALNAESPTDSTGAALVSPLLDEEMVTYLARFADGDARTALNLLELAMNLSTRKGVTKENIKKSLTHTLVYDRSGDMHYDAISAFHKSCRGSDPDAALFWLGRMLNGGEDPLYIARRMVVIASEDIGLADNSMLSLATATFAAVQQVGLPEARINLAHCATALAMAKKSTRAYRALGKVMDVLEKDPVIAGLAVPIHLRNAPTKLMKELNYGAEYKYNPDYKDGKVKQEYLPAEMRGMRFLEDADLGSKIDPDLQDEDEDYGSPP